MKFSEIYVFERHVSPLEFSHIGAFLPVGLCLYSAPRKSLYFLNDRLASWLNHSDPLAMGFHPDDTDRVERNLFGRLNGVCEGRIRNREGDWIWFQFQTSVFSETEMLIVIQNINDQKDEHFRSIHTAKLAALGEMSGAIAHEINNPLAVIAAKADLLKRKITASMFTPESAMQSLQEIYDMTFRISKIMKGLRHMLRKSDTEPFETVSLESILIDVCLLTGERFAKESVRFQLSPIPTISLSCRPVQISQIFINLLNNAYDAVLKKPKNERSIQITFDVQAQRVRCLVSDSGQGVDPKIRGHLMQPFQTTKTVGGGMGLGLSISRSIAQEHDGHLIYLPNLPETTFCLELPRHKSVVTPRAA